jgi:acyl dehydratase
VIEEMKMVINDSFNKVRFINPVPVGSRLRSKMVISAVEEESPTQIMAINTHTIEIEGQAKSACVAEAVGMLFL